MFVYEDRPAPGPRPGATATAECLVYFGCTSCPDVCPVHLATLGQALSELAQDKRANVDVLFVSVDPTVDTPERLRSCLAAYDREITDPTGTPEQVNAALASLPCRVAPSAPKHPSHRSTRRPCLANTSDGRAQVVWPFGTRRTSTSPTSAC